MAHVLIAEDDANVFKLINTRLKNQGHEISWAQHGAQALDIAYQQPIDLILLDIKMPILNGFQVLNSLKSDARTQNIPVIILTAHSKENDIISGLVGGADDYIVKPFSFPELIARINTSLARRTHLSPP